MALANAIRIKQNLWSFAALINATLAPMEIRFIGTNSLNFRVKLTHHVVASIGNLKAMLSKKGPAIVLIYRRSSQNGVFIRPLITLYLHARCVNREMNGMM